MGIRGMKALLAMSLAGTIGAAGCSSDSGSAAVKSGASVPGVQRVEMTTISRAAVDADGVAWILGVRDQRLTLVAIRPSQVGETSADLGPANRFGSIGMALVADGAHGVVVGAVHCASSDDDPEVCTDPVLDTTEHVVDGNTIRSSQWAMPAPVTHPDAVSLAGRGPGSLALRSGDVIVSKASTIIAGPTDASRVCLDDGVFTSVEDLSESASAPSTVPSDGTPIDARLSQLVDGKWQPIAGSEISHAWATGHTMDFRCGAHGIELAYEGQPASKIWDGTVWQERRATSTSWMTYDAPPSMTIAPTLARDGLTGIDQQGNIVLVDSATGVVRSHVSPPSSIDRWWESTEKGVRTGVLAVGTGDPATVVSCPSGNGTSTRCDTWVADR